MNILKKSVAVFLLLLMVFSSVPVTESFAKEIVDFSGNNQFAINASDTDISTTVSNDEVEYSQAISAADTSTTVSNYVAESLPATSAIDLKDNFDLNEAVEDEDLKRSDINFMNNGISTFNLRTPANKSSSNPNTYTVLLLDIEAAHNLSSGGKHLCTLGSPVSQVKAAALKLIEQIRLTRGTTNVAIVTFCSTVKVVQNFTTDYTVMKKSINSIGTGSTWANINGAFKKADELLSAVSDKNVDKNIVLFSQGLPYEGEYSTSGKYSQSDCSWYRTDNNNYAYQYANSAYATAEKLKSKYNIYSVGLYQSFDIVPEEGQSLLNFAKKFNYDVQNNGYYDITNIDDLEFSFAQELFNLAEAIDPDKIIIPVRAIDISGNLVPIEGAEVTIYLGSEVKDAKRSGSDGYVVFSKNELYQKGVSAESLNNCTVSAHYNVGDVILCSEDIYTNGTWAGEKLMSGYSLICDEPRQYVDLTIAYSSSIKQSKIEKLMSNYAKDLAQMTNGHILLSDYSLIQVNSDAELPSTNADIKVYKKLNGVAHSNVGGYKNGGRIEIDDSDNSATLCHESGHLLFGFFDEYKAAGKDGTETDYNMSPLWSNLKLYSSNNGYVDRPDQAPSLFGVMERQQKTLEMSNKGDYFYVELLEGSKESQPEAYTWQYYYNGTSTEGQLMGNFERAVNSYGYSINYTDTMGSPMTTEYWFAELSDSNSITPIEYQYDVYFDAEVTNEELADIEFSYLNDNLLIKTNNSNILCYTYLDGVVSEVTFELDGDYRITQLDLSNINVLTFAVVKEVDNKYFRNEYVIEKYVSMYDAFSAEQHLFYSNDENSNTVIQISSNISEQQDEYYSVSKKHYVLCDSTFGVINENLSYVPNVNYDLLQWYYTDVNGISSFLNTSITIGESNSINASCAFAGIGTYVLMSSNVSDRLEVSPSIVNISTANCLYDEQIEIELETISDEVPAFYKLYQSRNSAITNELLATMEYEVFSYDDSIFVDLSDSYGKYYFAVTAVFRDGSESALSNVYSYDAVEKDSDTDGIPDYWIEKYYQLADLDNIATADPDNDGLDNLTEYEYDTNPLNPDTDGDNVYDKIELLKGLDPLKPLTDGKTDDYIVAYGIPDLEICEITFDEDFIYFSVKNDTDGKAMRTLVEVSLKDEIIAMWSVNIDGRSIIQFALDRSVVGDGRGLVIEVDSGKLVRDSDYSNNVFEYSSASNISLSDVDDIVKGTTQQLLLNVNPVESNEIYRWELIDGDCITINLNTREITANKIGQATVSVETLQGLSAECLVSVVAFEGAEYSEFDSKLINNNTEVSIIGYIGNDTEIVIPKTIGSLPVTQLYSNAFENCTFKEVVIHSEIDSIANTTFSNTKSLENIVVDPQNITYCSVDGILYSYDKTQLIKYPSAKNEKLFTIPETVTKIGAYSINDCDYIEEITIPEKVSSIGSLAISNCDNLKIINYNAISCSTTNMLLILSSTTPFKNSNMIEKVIIGDNVTVIPMGLFYNKSNLSEVIISEDSKLSTVDQYAFYGCSKLNRITLPLTVESIRSNAFSGCSDDLIVRCYKNSFAHNFATENSFEYEFIKLDADDLVVTDFQEIFVKGSEYQFSAEISPIHTDEEIMWKSSDNDVVSVTDSGLVTANNNGEATLTVTTSRETISKAFNIKVVGVDNCECELIDNNTSLKITRYIGNNENVVIPEVSGGIPVTEIGESTFENCKFIKSITIPESITYIGESAFKNCINLEKVLYLGDLKSWCEVDFANETANPLNFAADLYIDNVLKTEISIPKNIKEIKPYTFYGCNSLEKLVIPNGVETVGFSAFGNCSNLKDVVLSETIDLFEGRAFVDCKNIEEVRYNGSLSDWCNITFSSYFLDGAADVYSANPLCYAKKFYISDVLQEEIIIPNDVVTISRGAFFNADFIKKVEIANDLETIENYAFAFCDNIQLVSYNGTQSEWEAIKIGTNNESILNAPLYCKDGHIHAYKEEIIKEATYEETGIKRYVCVCGHGYTEEIPVLKKAIVETIVPIRGTASVKLYKGEKYIAITMTEGKTATGFYVETSNGGTIEITDAQGAIQVLEDRYVAYQSQNKTNPVATMKITYDDGAVETYSVVFELYEMEREINFDIAEKIKPIRGKASMGEDAKGEYILVEMSEGQSSVGVYKTSLDSTIATLDDAEGLFTEQEKLYIFYGSQNTTNPEGRFTITEADGSQKTYRIVFKMYEMDPFVNAAKGLRPVRGAVIFDADGTIRIKMTSGQKSVGLYKTMANGATFRIVDANGKMTNNLSSLMFYMTSNIANVTAKIIFTLPDGSTKEQKIIFDMGLASDPDPLTYLSAVRGKVSYQNDGTEDYIEVKANALSTGVGLNKDCLVKYTITDVDGVMTENDSRYYIYKSQNPDGLTANINFLQSDGSYKTYKVKFVF